MWSGTAHIEIAAPPEVVWAVIADIPRHQEIQGNGEIKSIRMQGPVGAGALWGADERIKGAGAFTARSECTVFEPGSAFEWRSYPPPISKRHPTDSVADVRWGFTLRRTPSGTHVEQTFTVIPPKAGGLRMRIFYLVTRRARSIRAGNERTLQNLKRIAEHDTVRA